METLTNHLEEQGKVSRHCPEAIEFQAFPIAPFHTNGSGAQQSSCLRTGSN